MPGSSSAEGASSDGCAGARVAHAGSRDALAGSSSAGSAGSRVAAAGSSSAGSAGSRVATAGASSGAIAGSAGCAGSAELDEYVVGQSVDYWCKHTKKWKPAVITKKLPSGGLHISARSAPLRVGECSARLRRPQCAEAARARAQAEPDPGEQSACRGRHTFDDTWPQLVTQWLAAFGSVAGIFEKFRSVYADAPALERLKSTMTQVFPRLPAPLDYTAFEAQPGDGVTRGHIHPCSHGYYPLDSALPRSPVDRWYGFVAF